MNLTINKNESQNKKYLLIFVHGLTGGDESFYESRDKKYFSDFLDQEILNLIDIGTLIYHSENDMWEAIKFWVKAKYKKIVKNEIIVNNLTIEELSMFAKDEILKVIDDYDSINFICHSMGGLVIKSLLISDTKVLGKTNFYITLGTPHRGTKTAKFEYGMNRQVNDLKETSQIITYLSDKFELIKDKINCRYYVAEKDEWVKPQENSYPMFETDNIFLVNCSHTEISKPRKLPLFIPFLKDVNKTVSKFLNVKKPKSIHEILESKIAEIDLKMDKILSQCCKETQTEQSYDISHEQIDLLPGYNVKSVLLYEEETLYILLTKSGNTDNIIIKYNISKGIDIEFADKGIYFIEFNSSNTNIHNLLLRDNLIYIIGESVHDNHFNISISRITTDGLIDSSFADNGKFLFGSKDEHLYANNSILLDNGNIITCGANFQKKVLLLMCINPNGNLVSSFGDNGFVEEKYDTGQAWANCICKYDNNSFLIAGRTGSWEIFVSKFYNNGKRDTSNFINSGVTIHKHFLRVEDIKIQSNGKILVAGVGNEGRIIRLNANGELDISFAEKGVLEVITNLRSEVLSLEVFSNDSFVVGGMEYDGNSIQNGIIAVYTKNGIKDDSILENGFNSFQIVSKTSVKKILIHSDTSLTLISNYNIDYSENRRAKLVLSHLKMKKNIN